MLEHQLGQAQELLKRGDAAGAEVVLDGLCRQRIDDPATLAALSSLLSYCDRYLQALQYAARAAELQPEPDYLFNLATLQRMTGDLAGAEEICDRVIADAPGHYRAWFLRSNLRTWDADRNHIDSLRGVLKQVPARDWRGQVMLNYALAKELEDTGQYALSFEHVAFAAQHNRAHMRYNVDNDVATMDAIMHSHTRKALSLHEGHPTNQPIFVFGLPRTGTTLVDRILSSHSEVVSLGEPNAFAMVMQQGINALLKGEKADRIRSVRASLELDMAQLGEAYLQAVTRGRQQTQRLIDKLPLNFLYAGLISAALPNARIVHLTRHPMDACYAIFKTYFTGIYPFSYDLQELGKYYIAYHRLMDHWRKTLGERLHEVSYEALVADQEAQSRALIKFCGLGWEDACLEFHRNAAPATSASAAQVRRPVYSSSVGLWKNYAHQLQGLREQLQAAGIPT